MYVLCYVSMLRCCLLVWILVRTDHPCLGVGCHKGDPLSPLLFLVVVDVLQQLIKHFSNEGHLLHPIVQDSTCPVIQYADDTLILFQGYLEQARILKEILDALFPLLRPLDNRVDTLSIKGASSGGRLTLTKSILSTIPFHVLACIKAPKWFYKEIGNRRMGYFWTGQTSASGGQCKVAWDIAYELIEEGGLDIKNLETQNICLLLKFIHKLQTSNNCS
jgi:hypothetical protein